MAEQFIAPFSSPDELLEEQKRRRQENFQLALQRNAQSQPNAANQAAADVGTLFGSWLGRKLSKGDRDEALQQAEARQQAASGVFQVSPNQRANVTTPQGGITQTQRPRRQSEMLMQQAEKLARYGEEFGDTTALQNSMALQMKAMETAKAERAEEEQEKARGIVAEFALNPRNDELYAKALKATGDYKGLSDLRKVEDQKAYSKYGKVARDLGYTPETPEYIDYVSEASRKDKAKTESSTIGKINPQFYTPESLAAFEDSVQMGTPDYGLLKETDSLTPFAKQEQVKQSIKQVNTRNEKFAVQQNTNMKVRELQNLLDRGLDTGITEDLLLPIKKVATELTGAEFDQVPEQELFNALSNQLALMIRNPDSGMGLPGATSNRDIQFLTSSVSRLAGTPEGNKLILEQYDKLYNFNKDIIDYQNKLIKENNGVVPFDLESKLSDYGSNYEFYDEGERKEIMDAQIESMLSPETRAILNGDN